jgi:hypothetical protein
MSISNEVATGLDNQFIIYAKHWYGHSASIIDDVKAIMAKFSATPLHLISDSDAWSCLASAAAWGLGNGGAYIASEVLLDLAGQHYLQDLRNITPEASFISCLKCIRSDQFHFEDKWEDWIVPNDPSAIQARVELVEAGHPEVGHAEGS